MTDSTDSAAEIQPSGYPLPWYKDEDEFPEDPDMWRGWTAQDYTLAYALGVEDNHQANDLVEAALVEIDPALCARVRFDSEAGCFFAHTDTQDDMVALAAVVAGMVAATHPSAIPGDITTSPAFIGRWSGL